MSGFRGGCSRAEVFRVIARDMGRLAVDGKAGCLNVIPRRRGCLPGEQNWEAQPRLIFAPRPIPLPCSPDCDLLPESQGVWEGTSSSSGPRACVPSQGPKVVPSTRAACADMANPVPKPSGSDGPSRDGLVSGLWGSGSLAPWGTNAFKGTNYPEC